MVKKWDKTAATENKPANKSNRGFCSRKIYLNTKIALAVTKKIPILYARISWLMPTKQVSVANSNMATDVNR